MKLLLIFILAFRIITAQQVGDSTYNPFIADPMYKPGEGSIILIDEAHNNFHTMSDRYKPFADVLEKDGYNVRPDSNSFSITGLGSAKILVISNALNERNTEEWVLPTPSAFTQDEIDAVVEWVDQGGSLFLIADHMPFPGAAGDLARRFGFKLNNGFAFDTTNQGADLFTRKDNTLIKGIITEGRYASESVDSIYSFTGEGFQIPEDAYPVLIFNKNFISVMPDTAWNFKDTDPRISIAGWSQGAVKSFGKGKVVVWGEAAMFSAQTANNRKVGLNAPYARHNLQLLLNIIHWLDGRLVPD